MAQPLTRFQEPGFFSQIKESPSLFLLPGTVQTIGIIGAGRADRSVIEELLTRAADADDTDALANPIFAITRAYSDAVFQYPTSSYGASMTGTVTISVDLDGENLDVSLNGGATQSFTFGSGDDTASEAAVVINATAIGFVAVDESGALKLLTGTTIIGDGGGKLEILATSSADALTNTGFTAGQLAQEIDWTASIASTDPAVRPLATGAYLVDYTTPKVAADLEPKFFFSARQATAEYGDPSLENQLSLGLKAAFDNGAAIVACRQIDPNASTVDEIRAEFIAGLAAFEPHDISIIVPMTADEEIWDEVLQHVSKMSSQLERKERIAILGRDETAGRKSILGGGADTWETAMSTFSGASESSGLQTKRIIVLNPGFAEVNLNGVTFITDGAFLAAALAGRMVNAAFDEATPMTRKDLASIEDLSNNTEQIIPELLRSEKNTLTGLGVTVLERSGQLVIVRRAVTANSNSIASQEPSIVRAFDRVSSEMRIALENRFIGQKITNTTKGEVATAVNTFLLRFVEDEIISAFRNIEVNQNSVEPRQVDISFEALPIFPFNWGSLDITITVE